MQDPSTKDLKTCQPWSCPKNQLSWQTHQIDQQILVLRPRTKQFILYSSCFLWSFSFFFSQQITPYHPYHFLYPCSLHAPSIILTASFAIFSLSKNHSPPYLNSQTRTYVEVCMKWKKDLYIDSIDTIHMSLNSITSLLWKTSLCHPCMLHTTIIVFLSQPGLDWPRKPWSSTRRRHLFSSLIRHCIFTNLSGEFAYQSVCLICPCSPSEAAAASLSDFAHHRHFPVASLAQSPQP